MSLRCFSDISARVEAAIFFIAMRAGIEARGHQNGHTNELGRKSVSFDFGVS